MNLTVHIGTTKTGSTSIQSFLKANRAALAKRGICYPASLGPLDHRWAVLSSIDPDQSPDLLKRHNLKGETDLLALRDKTQAAYLEDLASRPETVIISSEHLHSRCVRPENVARFRDLFCQGFETIRIVVYVRPQLEHLISLYSTLLRNGFTVPLNRYVKRYLNKPELPYYFDLRAVILCWSDVFGAENVIVRPYKGISGEMGTLGDFCNLVGLDPTTPDWVVEKQANTSINVAGQKLLLMLNETGALNEEQRYNLVQWTETHCAGKGAAPRPKLAQRFQALFDEGNAWVVENYFPGHPEYLEPRRHRRPGRPA